MNKVIRISKPYEFIARSYAKDGKVFQKETHKIEVGDIFIGSKKPVIIAGPCSVESEEQVVAIAEYVSKLGIRIMRGGAYKLRSSPYSFQGMGLKGLQILAKASKKFGLKLITEATGMHHHIDEHGRHEKKMSLKMLLSMQISFKSVRET